MYLRSVPSRRDARSSTEEKGDSGAVDGTLLIVTPPEAPTTHEPPGDLDAAVARARAAAAKAHREVVQRREAYLAAEEEFIARVAEAQLAGEIDWRAVYEAYQQVREWSQLNGASGFLARWQRHIPIDPIKLSRLADTVSADEGDTWSGATGWDGLERGGYPPNGAQVTFVLFGNGGEPLRYGVTSTFKTRTGRMHKSEGLRWSSWTAYLARDAEDARAQQAELIARYGRPNAATATTPAPLHAVPDVESMPDQL